MRTEQGKPVLRGCGMEETTAPDVPEMLVEGHEREYLTWFYRHTCNPAAITKEDIDEYVSHYSAPGGMRSRL